MPDSESDITSTFQRFCSAKRVYMRKISAAKSEASSPPVPARISRMTFFSSLGSLGSSKTLRSSSRACVARLERGDLFLRHGAQVGVALGQHGARVGQALANLLELAVFFDGSFDFAQRFGGLLVVLVVVQDFRQRELRLQFVVALLHLFQAIDHGIPCRSRFWRGKWKVKKGKG